MELILRFWMLWYDLVSNSHSFYLASYWRTGVIRRISDTLELMNVLFFILLVFHIHLIFNILIHKNKVVGLNLETVSRFTYPMDGSEVNVCHSIGHYFLILSSVRGHFGDTVLPFYIKHWCENIMITDNVCFRQNTWAMKLKKKVEKTLMLVRGKWNFLKAFPNKKMGT